MKILSKVKFKETDLVEINDQYFYVWPITEEVKEKIKAILNQPDLIFGFVGTMEIVPQFECSECGKLITFFDQVRTGVENAPHSKQHLVELIQQSKLLGTGSTHPVYCENGHLQPIILGWATGFEWTYNER